MPQAEFCRTTGSRTGGRESRAAGRNRQRPPISMTEWALRRAWGRATNPPPPASEYRSEVQMRSANADLCVARLAQAGRLRADVLPVYKPKHSIGSAHTELTLESIQPGSFRAAQIDRSDPCGMQSAKLVEQN